MKRLVGLFLLAVVACLPCTAQAQVPLDHLPALAGGYHRLDSARLGRPLHVYVRLPTDYEAQPDRRYPIVYLLDGDSLFPLLATGHLLLTIDDRLPEAIIVGIAYGGFGPGVNRRSLDFTPPGEGVDPAAAGAPAFLEALETELLPLVERSYRADPARRILFGQSRGGSFVLYSAFARPDLFWGRIASNAAFHPGNERLTGPAPRATRPDLRLVVTSGSRDRPELRAAFLAWERTWVGRRDAPWRLRTITIEDGTHAADALRAYRAAMNWLLASNGGSGSGEERAEHHQP
jgi:uncharacterized protein